MRAAIQPVEHRRCLAIAEGTPEHVERKAVDLEKDDAGHVRLGAAIPPGGNTRVVQIDVIVIERQQRDQQRVGRCHGQRQQDAVEEARDLEPAHQSRGQQDYGAVDHKRREAERQDGDREHEANEHRPDQPVEDSDCRGAHERRRPILDVDAGEHQGEHAQHDGRRNPAEGDPGDAA